MAWTNGVLKNMEQDRYNKYVDAIRTADDLLYEVAYYTVSVMNDNQLMSYASHYGIQNDVEEIKELKELLPSYLKHELSKQHLILLQKVLDDIK